MVGERFHVRVKNQLLPIRRGDKMTRDFFVLWKHEIYRPKEQIKLFDQVIQYQQ